MCSHSAFFSAMIVVLICGDHPAARAFAQDVADEGDGWRQSYDAGYIDENGAYAGGSEIMHLAPHKDKLFATNGYWMDERWTRPEYREKQSAQVLRLDKADGQWQVDLDLGQSGAGTGDGVDGMCLRYMKGNILKSIRFTRDGQGRELPQPIQLLVMAAGAHPGRQGVVSVWVRDDDTATWRHTIVLRGLRTGDMRYIPRDMEVYQDKVTGLERLFLLCGNSGIMSGVYDASATGKIRWDQQVEFPREQTLATRPLGIAQANGSLYFSAGNAIYQRRDGTQPIYRRVLDLGGSVSADLGGVRGLTAIANPNGTGESLLFVWAPRGRSAGTIKRLDPDGDGGFTEHDEANLRDLMSKKLGREVLHVLGGYNDFYPVTDPKTGETCHFVGLQGVLASRYHNDELMWQPSRYYAGAIYAVRCPDQRYTVQEVAGPYSPGQPALVAPRTFALSPFGDASIFIGGHDANFHPSSDRAWIFRAPIDIAAPHRHELTAPKN